MDVAEHLKMWDQFIESKTTLNPSVKESEMLKICFPSVKYKELSTKGGAIDTDPGVVHR
jgi:hypothetical protein